MGEQQQFDWQRRPEVESFLLQVLEHSRQKNKVIERLDAKVKAITSTVFLIGSIIL